METIDTNIETLHEILNLLGKPFQASCNGKLTQYWLDQRAYNQYRRAQFRTYLAQARI